MSAIQAEPLAEQIAAKFTKLGGHVIFFPRGTKRCTEVGWEQSATNNIDTAIQRARKNAHSNVGLVGKQNGLWALDIDDAAVQAEIIQLEQQHGPVGTYCTRTVSGGHHLIFRQSTASWEMGNISVKDGNKRELLSARIDDRYVVLAGSWAHPHNDESLPLIQYTALNPDAPIIEAPAWLLDFIKSKAVQTVSSGKVLESTTDKIAHEGGRNNHLTSVAGKMRQSFGWGFEKIRQELIVENERACVPPLPNSEVDSIARSVSGYEVQPGDIILNQKPDSQQIPSQAILIPDEDPDWEFDIAPKEYEHQMENEFPVLPLKPGHGPTWDDDIMYGIAGDIVRKAAEYCEAHPAGMYLDILVSFGNLVGRDPYFNVSSTSHFANEFMVRVGESSVSRKGTGRDVVNEVLKMIDPQWYSACVLSGFGSAEAIINVIRDDSIQSIRKKNNSFEDILVPGVKDKRLMIREGELASIFQLAGKPESRADVVLRDGWDSKPLNNVVKGKTNGLSNSNACQYPHLSISADTTKQELIRKMPAGAESNGFGNRFLYCYVRRVKYCPNGGPSIDWRPELMRLNEALRNARELKYVGMQGSTRTLWGRMYMEIQKEAAALSGIVASMTARAEPHVRRLALILCLLDGKDAVETYHLHAAKKIWDYCQDSTRYIFGGLTKDQESILSWLRTSGPVTITQITQQLFYKNRKAGWVRLQVNALIATGKIELKEDKVVAKS